MISVDKGKYLLTCSGDGYLKIWDVFKAECVLTIKAEYAKKSSMNTMTMLNEHEVAVGTDNGEIFVFDWKTGNL